MPANELDVRQLRKDKHQTIFATYAALKSANRSC